MTNKTDAVLRQQSILGIIYKLLSFAISFFSVRFLLDYMGSSLYGVWATLLSIFSWVNVLNLGIGSSLQNKLSEAYVNGVKGQTQRLVSTAYITQAAISIAVTAAGLLLLKFIPLTDIIDTAGMNTRELFPVIAVMLAAASMMLVLNIYTNIYSSLNRTSTMLLAGVIIQCATAAAFALLNLTNGSSRLLTASAANAVISAAVILCFSFFLFRSRPHLRPGFQFFDKSLVRNILGISIRFFLIHLSWHIINTTDNLIISNAIGAEAVTTYSLVYKLLMLGKTAFFLLLTPLWPIFSGLYLEKNTGKIRELLRRYTGIMLIVDLGIILLAFLIPFIIRIWTGQSFIIPLPLIILTSLFMILDNEVGLFSCFLNAISRIRLQMILFIAGAAVNIPLSLLLINRTPLGSAGVILASCICYIPLTVAMPLQVKSELKTLLREQ